MQEYRGHNRKSRIQHQSKRRGTTVESSRDRNETESDHPGRSPRMDHICASQQLLISITQCPKSKRRPTVLGRMTDSNAPSGTSQGRRWCDKINRVLNDFSEETHQFHRMGPATDDHPPCGLGTKHGLEVGISRNHQDGAYTSAAGLP